MVYVTHLNESQKNVDERGRMNTSKGEERNVNERKEKKGFSGHPTTASQVQGVAN